MSILPILISLLAFCNVLAMAFSPRPIFHACLVQCFSHLISPYTIPIFYTNFRGLYCPPLILAGIRWNLGNSRNSAGIKFGRGTCQIDKTIPAEFRMEFKFSRNAGITLDGIPPEQNPRNP
jgi:hypothetical protein